MDYTRKLLLIRKILGLSQAALGKRIDLTGPHVYRLENGKSPITNVILDKYVEAFGVDPEWLMSENIEDIRFTGEIDGFNSLGNRIKEMRLEMDMSQKKFAEYACVQPGDINRVESGKSALGPQSLKRIAEAFHVGIDWLQYGDENRKEYPVDQKMIDWLWDHPEMRKQIVEEMKWGEDPDWCPEADFDKELECVDEQYRGLD